jgi:hypothetical protein
MNRCCLVSRLQSAQASSPALACRSCLTRPPRAWLGGCLALV